MPEPEISNYVECTRAHLAGHERPLPTPVRKLSPRELQTLQAIAEGASMAEAGEQVGVGIETIKTQLSVVRRKLSAVNTTHACVVAMRLGLLV